MKVTSTFNIIGLLSHGIWIFGSGTIDYITPFPKLFNLYVKMTIE